MYDAAAARPRPGLPCSLVTGGEVPYAALDYAASAPGPRAGPGRGRLAPYYGSVHRGAGYPSQLSTGPYEQPRRPSPAFLGCRPADQVLFTRYTTDSMNLLAAALPAGSQVFVFETEHHASLLPWRARRVPYLRPAHPGRGRRRRWTGAAVRAPFGPGARLRHRRVQRHRRAVAGPGTRRGRAPHGARIVLDAAQLAPHRPVDMPAGRRLGRASGHKLYAPFGAGVLAGRADWLREARPTWRAAERAAVPARGRRVDVDGTPAPATRRARRTSSARFAIASACKALTAAGFDPRRPRDDLVAPAPGRASRRSPSSGCSPVRRGRARVGIVSFVVDGWNARTSRRRCPRSTASASGTACSARTRWSGRCWAASPTSRAMRRAGPHAGGAPAERDPGQLRGGHPGRARGALRRAVRNSSRRRQVAYRTEDGRCVPAV